MNKFISICILIALCMCSFEAKAQSTQATVEVRGIIYDQADMTIPGATVRLKDRPGVGTTSDIDGNFSLKASVGDMMIVSFLGYKNHEHLVTKGEKDLVIKLEEDDQVLEEVVVTAMGTTQKKISVIGAITSLDVDQLNVPATSINNMLGGRMAGIVSRQISGEPGKNISEFWIRGIGTFGANQSALVLIDGLEGDLSQIDTSDVESISVLKDASATAVYGVRGANGVVLVTTKRGTEDRLQITGRANYTVSHLQRMPKYLRSYEYAQLANEAKIVRGDLPLYNNTQLELIKYHSDPDLYPDVNWRDEMLKNTSLQQTYYVSARGGGSLAKYFISLGMSDESAAYKMDKSKYSSGVGYKTYNYRANIDMNLTSTTSLYFGVDGWVSNRTQPGMANTDNLWSSQAHLTPIAMPTRYSTGEMPAKDRVGISPYVSLNHSGKTQQENSYNQITLALAQDLAFVTEGLKIRAQGALNRDTEYSERRFLLPALYYATGRSVPGGELQLAKKLEEIEVSYFNFQNQKSKFHFESTLNYEKLWGENHRTSGLVYYYMSSSKDLRDIDRLKGPAFTSMSAIPKKYQGVSSRLTYGFKDTYMVDINFGYTGSENFKPGHQFGFFPSVAVGWVATNYDFVRETIPFLSSLKFRGSYGLVGNDRITNARFPYLTILSTGEALGWSSSSWTNMSGGGISENIIGADNLEWEKAKKFNVGVDGKLFGQAIDFTVDYFYDRRDGIFQSRVQIPDYIGLVSKPFGNVGEMHSWGSDGNISYFHKINKDMSFVVRGNYTFSQNEIKNWEQTKTKYPYQEYSDWANGIQRGYVAQGLFKDQADVDNSPKQTFGEYMAGDIKYKDVNGDGKIDSDDQVPLSFSDYPLLMYGFGGEFSYKNLTVGVLFKGIGKKDFFYTTDAYPDNGIDDRGLGFIPFLNGETGNVLEMVADQKNRWTPASYSGDPSTENPNARFPRLSYGENENNRQISSFWKANGQYLRLQEVSINYNLKHSYLKKLGVRSIDLQLVGSDLYVWDKIDGLYDPEQSSKNGLAYPIPARYAFQLYINL